MRRRKQPRTARRALSAAPQSRPAPPPRPTASQAAMPANRAKQHNARPAHTPARRRRRHAETTALRQALEPAHGENLRLRRRLAAARDPAPGNDMTGPPTVTDAYATAITR